MPAADFLPVVECCEPDRRRGFRRRSFPLLFRDLELGCLPRVNDAVVLFANNRIIIGTADLDVLSCGNPDRQRFIKNDSRCEKVVRVPELIKDLRCGPDLSYLEL